LHPGSAMKQLERANLIEGWKYTRMIIMFKNIQETCMGRSGIWYGKRWGIIWL
jgi:hypothetical protein